MQVQPKQVWEDVDNRRTGRTFEVVSVGNYFATVDDGNRVTKIRLNRFKPKYYRLKNPVQHATNQIGKRAAVAVSKNTPLKPVVTPVTSPSGPTRNELSDECAKVFNGNWGGFGAYAFFDNDKVHIIVRQVRMNTYDVKVRLNGHLVYSDVSRTDLVTTLGQLNTLLKSLRDNIDDVVN